MTQQTERMGHLVNDLLTLSRLEGSPRPGADRWVGVDALLRACRGRGASAVGRAPRHRRSPLAAGAEIAGSRDRAAERASATSSATPSATRPTAAASTSRWQLARTTAAASSRCVDTRPRHRARAHLPRLTERFYRVDGSRSRETGGTGLGLAIVKHVVQRHGGELDIDSEPGKGSTFRLVFPSLRVRLRRRAPRSQAADAGDAIDDAVTARPASAGADATVDVGEVVVAAHATFAADELPRRGRRLRASLVSSRNSQRRVDRARDGVDAIAAEVLERDDLRARHAGRGDAGAGRARAARCAAIIAR